MPVPLAEARAILAAFVKEQMDNSEELTLDRLLALARRRYLRDAAFQQVSARELIEFLLPQVTQRQRAEVREVFVEAARQGRPAFQAAAEAKLESWFESIGPGRSKRLLELTRPELAYSISMREAQVAGELRTLAFQRELLSLLPNDRMTIRQAIPLPALEDLFMKHYGEEAA